MQVVEWEIGSLVPRRMCWNSRSRTLRDASCALQNSPELSRALLGSSRAFQTILDVSRISFLRPRRSCMQFHFHHRTSHRAASPVRTAAAHAAPALTRIRSHAPARFNIIFPRKSSQVACASRDTLNDCWKVRKKYTKNVRPHITSRQCMPWLAKQ